MMQVFIVFFVVITAVGWWLVYYENIYGSDINCWLIETILIFLSNYQTTAVDKKTKPSDQERMQQDTFKEILWLSCLQCKSF